jgi:hypothetical protein
VAAAGLAAPPQAQAVAAALDLLVLAEMPLAQLRVLRVPMVELLAL